MNSKYVYLCFISVSHGFDLLFHFFVQFTNLAVMTVDFAEKKKILHIKNTILMIMMVVVLMMTIINQKWRLLRERHREPVPQ